MIPHILFLNSFLCLVYIDFVIVLSIFILLLWFSSWSIIFLILSYDLFWLFVRPQEKWLDFQIKIDYVVGQCCNVKTCRKSIHQTRITDQQLGFVQLRFRPGQVIHLGGRRLFAFQFDAMSTFRRMRSSRAQVQACCVEIAIGGCHQKHVGPYPIDVHQIRIVGTKRVIQPKWLLPKRRFLVAHGNKC